MTHQMLFFKADTGNALTTILAGFAATITSFPNINLFPALVAGFFLVLIMQTPGIVNLPTLFTSLAPSSVKAPSTFVTSFLFKLTEDVIPLTIPDFDRARTPAFITFMAFMVFGSMFCQALFAQE